MKKSTAMLSAETLISRWFYPPVPGVLPFGVPRYALMSDIEVSSALEKGIKGLNDPRFLIESKYSPGYHAPFLTDESWRMRGYQAIEAGYRPLTQMLADCAIVEMTNAQALIPKIKKGSFGSVGAGALRQAVKSARWAFILLEFVQHKAGGRVYSNEDWDRAIDVWSAVAPLAVTHNSVLPSLYAEGFAFCTARPAVLPQRFATWNALEQVFQESGSDEARRSRVNGLAPRRYGNDSLPGGLLNLPLRTFQYAAHSSAGIAACIPFFSVVKDRTGDWLRILFRLIVGPNGYLVSSDVERNSYTVENDTEIKVISYTRGEDGGFAGRDHARYVSCVMDHGFAYDVRLSWDLVKMFRAAPGDVWSRLEIALVKGGYKYVEKLYGEQTGTRAFSSNGIRIPQG